MGGRRLFNALNVMLTFTPSPAPASSHIAKPRFIQPHFPASVVLLHTQRLFHLSPRLSFRIELSSKLHMTTLFQPLSMTVPSLVPPPLSPPPPQSPRHAPISTPHRITLTSPPPEILQQPPPLLTSHSLLMTSFQRALPSYATALKRLGGNWPL